MNWKKMYSNGFDMKAPKELKGSTYIDTWLLDRGRSTKTKLYFQSFNSNLFPLPDIAVWSDGDWRETQVKYALQKFKSFDGHVWLDSLKIK